MVADAVHDLPLSMSEADEEQEIAIERLLVVDEIMADTDETDHQGRTGYCEDIGLFQDSQSDTDKPQSQNNKRIHLRNTLILQLSNRPLLQHPLPQSPIKSPLLKSKPTNPTPTLPHIIFLQHIPRLSLIQMMDNKMLGDVLASG